MMRLADEFCALLAAGVPGDPLRHRDAGQFTISSSGARGSTNARATRTGEKVEAPYLLTDLVADTVGLSTRSASRRTHVVGCRWEARFGPAPRARHPEGLTLTRSCRTPVSRASRRRSPEAWSCLTAPSRRAEPFSNSTSTSGASTAVPSTRSTRLPAAAAAGVFEAWRPNSAGRDRQMAAILASGRPAGSARRGSCPTLVIHARVIRGAHRGGRRPRGRSPAPSSYHRGDGARPAEGGVAEVVDAIARHGAPLIAARLAGRRTGPVRRGRAPRRLYFWNCRRRPHRQTFALKIQPPRPAKSPGRLAGRWFPARSDRCRSSIQRSPVPGSALADEVAECVEDQHPAPPKHAT